MQNPSTERRRRFVDYTGKTSGIWTVVKFLGYHPTRKTEQLYHCVDIFGGSAVFTGSSIRKKKFGLHLRTPESRAMRKKIAQVRFSMIKRCYKSSHKSYSTYGGRGITICEEWLGETGSWNFMHWCIANGYLKTPDLSVDRINPDGPYSPENCRLISKVENSRYTRNTLLSFDKASEIREAFKINKLVRARFCNEQAEKYGCGPDAISSILYNRVWKQ